MSVLPPLTSLKRNEKIRISFPSARYCPWCPAGWRVPVLEIKNKSSFQMERNGRNPFWPIGFKPAAELSNRSANHAGPDVPLTAFLLTSITLDLGTHFAIINGKTMQEGQQFSLQSGSQNYQIKLKSIE